MEVFNWASVGKQDANAENRVRCIGYRTDTSFEVPIVSLHVHKKCGACRACSNVLSFGS